MAAMVNASASPIFKIAMKQSPNLSPVFSTNLLPKFPTERRKDSHVLWSTLGVNGNGLRNGWVCLAVENSNEQLDIVESGADEDYEQLGLERESVLYSVSPFPLLLLAALLPGATTVRSLFRPFVELIKSWNLPDWLIHWGHPFNMAVVLFAMGGYGTYLGFRIRSSDDLEEKAKAKDLHPKLMAGMFFFFALGATGGVTSLLTSDKPIFESPHTITGAIGLALLTVQTILPASFEGNPGLRNVHGILGSGIMTLFFIHLALGLQLGLSY